MENEYFMETERVYLCENVREIQRLLKRISYVLEDGRAGRFEDGMSGRLTHHLRCREALTFLDTVEQAIERGYAVTKYCGSKETD